MKHAIVSSAVAILICAALSMGQQSQTQNTSVPIYRVTVVERNLEAVNYQYRSGPTEIDLRGTVLLDKAKGDAWVDSRRGRTEINVVKLEGLLPPTRFGPEYLTYVIWAISPEGRPHNLGEVIPDGSDHAKLHVTTDLQAFGIIITAEPYASVRQPSDVVVMENHIRPDTQGIVKPVEAKYALLPRGQYTWQTPSGLESAVASAPKVSMGEYETVLELYQAQNALGIARAAGAEQYAPNTLAKAQQLLDQAQSMQASKGPHSVVIQNAREASQTADDAREIAVRKQQEEKLAQSQTEMAQMQQKTMQAEATAQQAQAAAADAQAQAQAERSAREQAEAEAAAARQQVQQLQNQAQNQAPPATMRPQAQRSGSQQSELRMRLLEQLNGVLGTVDTPRGLVVTVPDSAFSGVALNPATVAHVKRIAIIVADQPGLHVTVEGNSDSAAGAATAQRRAEAVRDLMIGNGLPAGQVVARGLGDSRLLVANSSQSARAQNRRVEIVITGDAIGTAPFWERTYSLTMR
jgi:outer membrane protein OmpA-like peptidoglycan-associated protein